MAQHLNTERSIPLFDLTERLDRIGRAGGSSSPDQSTCGSPYVRLVFTAQPQVYRRGGRRERLCDAVTEQLEDGLRRARRMRLDAVFPRAIVEAYDVSGVRFEDVAASAVLNGRELILGPELPRGFALPGTGTPDVDAAKHMGELYELACRGICEPGRGLSGGHRRGGEWRLAWDTATTSQEALVLVAARIELCDAVVTGRGSYLIGGRESQPGYHGLRGAENSFVLEIAPTSGAFEGTKAVFWLGREALDQVIEALHRHVALHAIRRAGSGRLER